MGVNGKEKNFESRLVKKLESRLVRKLCCGKGSGGYLSEVRAFKWKKKTSLLVME